ncbi:hypothetical protein EFK50_19745 [Nocardioides marmoriginsengisoli]|uniref:Uncharacterized protein n=1 Tax=Nocardioides marmoriginsengisoli TaxID=661483 RepID=A0A3N0CC51_9ACTN|nr:hypothetical protein [Nocardioides marmoriginsengisoli]RNL60553.1 hypothetical protein EFK50_19745 [Nocardioides marmoriginsengisoli]
MSDHDDLKRALGLAATGDRAMPAAGEDLARAREALRARTRRRYRTGLGGLVLAAAVGFGTVGVLADRPDTSDRVQLVAERFVAAPYTFDLTPKGWSVQAQNPYAVTIVPDDGSISTHPDDFVGKLVITFDENPLSGHSVEHDGRRIWISTSDDYTSMATRTRTGEPSGIVRIQYPQDTHWNEAAMLDFLASVHVGPAARHGHG